MDVTTAQRLTEFTSDFYAQVGESFSATRGGAWVGWERVLAEAGLRAGNVAGQDRDGTHYEPDVAAAREPLRVLDVACGNLRFERYLASALPGRLIKAVCVDECDAMAEASDVPDVELEYVHSDVIEHVSIGHNLQNIVGNDRYDLAVCFGFMHHLPLAEQRTALLRALAKCVRPGGYVAVSFWQLSHSPELAAKAQRVTAEQAAAHGLHDLGRGDYLLGWQGRTDVLRYCHDFTEAEVDELADSTGLRVHEVARFSADGRTGNLNRYLVLQRR